ncbi:16924_t:CDS:2 [Rhizophagus irregularis]|nr:16924_t:CDS:2 [Rhizophagus irregularis]
MFKLFINENTKFTHLYIPQKFDYKIQNIPGAKHCFSEIGFLSCNTNINDEVLNGLTKFCKLIKELELFIQDDNNNYEIIKLIETPKKLFSIKFITKCHYKTDEPFCEILENSLIKHANIIQHFTTTNIPVTKTLTSFVNLKRLELDDNFNELKACNWLERLSFPFLQVLKARRVPIKVIIILIENSRGYLNEINIDYVSHDENNNKRIIQAIYQNCTYLKYLKLVIRNSNILELEKLLINCQYLNDSIKLFLDNWKGRHPILLQTTPLYCSSNYCLNNIDFMERYKAEGIVENYENVSYGQTFDDFEWIQKKVN